MSCPICLYALLALMSANVMLLAAEQTAGMSASFAGAIEAELQAHVRRMELRAAEMNDMHMRSMYKLKREREEIHARAKRTSSYHLSNLKHGFIPGTGLGNREDIWIVDLRLLRLPSIPMAPVVSWGEFSVDEKQFLVASTPNISQVELFRFTDRELTSLYQHSIKADVMRVFTQSLYDGTTTTTETKILLVSEEEAIILVAQNENCTEFGTQNVTGTLRNVTDAKFFEIGLDSYLVFSRNDDPTGDGSGTKSAIYMWSESSQMFKLRQEIRTYGAVEVEAFTIHGMHYILTVEKYNSTTLWRYNPRQLQFRVYQQLQSRGVKSALYFTEAYEHYLVLVTADSMRSVFYVWDGFYFQWVHAMPTPNASSWGVIRGTTCQDIGVLLLSSQRPWPGAIKAFNVTDDHEIVGAELPGASSLPRDDLAGARSTLSFNDWLDRTYVVMTLELNDKGEVIVQSLIFEVIVSVAPRESPYSIRANVAYEASFRVIETELDEYEKQVANLTDKLDDSITLSEKDITVGGDVIFNGTVTFNGTVEAQRVEKDEIITNNTIEGSRAGEVLDELEANVTRDQNSIAGLETSFEDRVTLDGNETITAHKTFKNLTIDGALQSQSITAPTINGVDIETLDDTAIRNDIDDQVVSGLIYFNQGLSVDDNIVLEDGVLVNGFDMDNAVTETGTQIITGPKTFSRDMTLRANAVMQANVELNSVDVSEEVVTLSNNHVLQERIFFQDALTVQGDITTTSTVDGIDVSTLAADVVRVNGDYTISGPVNFTQSVTANDDVTTGNSITDVDLADLNTRAVRINEDVTITGNKTFTSDLSIDGDVIANKFVDGFDLFRDTLFVNTSLHSLLGVSQPGISGILFPFGPSESDLTLPSGDDHYVELPLTYGFNFFGSSYNNLFINSNGIVSFVNSFTDYTPSPFPLSTDTACIAPYWCDVNTNLGGVIYYRQMTRALLPRDDPVFAEADRIICSNFRLDFAAVWLLIVTWDDVAYYGSSGSARNTYQLVLATDGVTSFAIFNYDDITWTTGTASGGDSETGTGGTPALVGFNAGDSVIYHEVEYSRTSSIVNIDERTNVDEVGRWIFKTDSARIEEVTYKGQTITGEKTFTNCVTVRGTMWVNGTIDGIKLDDAVTLTGTRTITGNKTFQGTVEVHGHIFPTGTVDDVDLSALQPNIMTRTTTQTVEGTIVFNDTLPAETNLNVGGDINGVDIAALAADAVYKNVAAAQTVTADKVFNEAVNATMGSLDFDGLVNGYDIPTDFMDLSSAQTVTVAKTFKDELVASGDLTVDGDVDEVNVTTLWEQAALTSRNEILSGGKNFSGDMTVSGNLAVGGNTNDVDLSEDVMMVNEAQTVNDVKKFRRVIVTGAVSADSAKVTNLNGQDWTSFVTGRVTLSTEQTVTGGVTFSAELDVNGNIETDDEVNGLDLPTFADSLLYESGEQEITGAYNFTDNVVFNDEVTLDETLDGVDIDVLLAKAIFLDDGTQTISARKTFKNNIVILNHLTVSDLVNYIELSALNEDIVWTNQGPQSITGKKVFEKGFTSQQNLVVTGTVNGVDISEEVLTLNRNQDITGSYTFEEDVTIAQELLVSEYINNVNITDVDISVVKLDVVQVVSSPITFTEDLEISGSISVDDGDTVDTVDLSALRDMAKLKDVPFSLPNPVTFSEPLTIGGSLDASGTVHGIDFRSWAATVLTKDTTQTITGNYGVSGTLEGEIDVNVPGGITADTAYGINVDEFVRDLVKLQGDQNITGSKTFLSQVTVEGNIEVQGTVDGIDISEEVVTLDGVDTIITGSKAFTACHVQTAQHILTTGTVSGYDIAQEHSDTLDFRSPKKVSGHKTFTKDVTVNGDLLVSGLVDGKNLSLGFTLDTDQTITAYHIFNIKSTVDGNVSVGGLVTDVNLAYIDANRITLSGDHTVNGSLTFSDMASFQDNVTTDYLFDGVDVSAISAQEVTRYDRFENQVNDLACYAQAQCERTESLSEVVNNFIDAIDYLEENQVLDEQLRQFESMAIEGVTYLAAAVYADSHGDICTSSVIYIWDAANGNMSEFQLINTNAAVAWKHFMIGEDDYIIVANSGHTLCPDTPLSNAIYKFETSNFTMVDSIGEELAATSDIDAFAIDGIYFLVLTTYDGSIATVYKYNEISSAFEVYQDIATGVTSSVECLVLPKGTFLIFALYLQESSVVYCYNPDSQLFEFFQEVESSHAREIASFHFQEIYGFVLADHISVSDVAASFDVEIRAYLWNDETENFYPRLSVPVVNPSDVDVFYEGNFIYMCVVQEHHSVDLYRYEGSAGFIKFYHIAFHGVRSVNIFGLQESEYAANDDYEYNQLFLAVAVDPFTRDEASSHILKIVNIGGSVQMRKWENMCDSGLSDPPRISTPTPTC